MARPPIGLFAVRLRALLSGTAGIGELGGCVDQRNVGKRLREISDLSFCLNVVFFGELHQWRSVTIHGAPGDWVFASPFTKGKRPFWPAQMMKKHIKPVALALGLPNIGWHSFRHKVSAWGKEAGLKLEEVKTLLRHENLATTSEVYGDLGMEAKRRIQQQLVNFVKQQATRVQPRPVPT